MPPVVKSGNLCLLEPSELIEALTGIVLAYRRPELAAGWTVRGSKLGVGEISRSRPNRPWARPASYTMSTGPLPGVKRPGRGDDHPPPSSAEVKEKAELYLYSPSGPSWPVIGRTFTFTFTTINTQTSSCKVPIILVRFQ
jgi:hypothetical protein